MRTLNLNLTSGDSFEFQCPFFADRCQTIIADPAGWDAQLHIRKHASDETPIVSMTVGDGLEWSDNTLIVSFSPEHTAALPVGVACSWHLRILNDHDPDTPVDDEVRTLYSGSITTKL